MKNLLKKLVPRPMPPLNAPRRQGEKQYTTLQLTRIQSRTLRWSRLRAAVGVAAMVAAVVFVISSVGNDAELGRQNDRLEMQNRTLERTNKRLQAALDAIVQARTEGRSTTCAGDQAFELNHNKLVQGTQDLINRVYGDGASTRPESERPAILSYAADRVAEFEATKVPVRSCTPDAIVQFYENAPKPQPCPNGDDGKGYCV